METKERILVKSHEQFNRFGIRSVSMDDIAAALGMSKKTLYQHFADKEELVSACFSQVMEQNRHQCLCDQKKAENPIHEFFLAYDMMQEMFANMNPVVLHEMEKYHPSAFRKFHEFKYGFLYKIISSNLERGIKEELYRPDIDVDVLVRFRIESVMLPFNSDVFPNNRTHLIHIELQLFEHFLYGLVTPKGQKLIQKYKTQRTRK
ncbi:MAG TPA: TetR/AcrR family transcriptional regulator [Flavisolibacter sp.]|nr:TetR/AcrR family transcriptional regulator [Flavisolibacter sp.]